jgi:hypothetical protein
MQRLISHHEMRISEELGEHLIEIRRLADVPQRLRMMQRHDAVEHRRAAIPCSAVRQVSPHERGDFANGVGDEHRRNDISDREVAVRAELLQVAILNPAGGMRRMAKRRAVGQSPTPQRVESILPAPRHPTPGPPEPDRHW